MLILFLMPAMIRAQQIPVQTIKGIVIDRSIRNALPGATVEVLSAERTAASDSSGSFRIDRIPVGRHTIRIAIKDSRRSPSTTSSWNPERNSY